MNDPLTNSPVSRWWAKGYKDPKKRAQAIVRSVRVLEDEQWRFHQNFEDNLWLYHPVPQMGLDREWHEPAIARKYGASATNIIEYNIDAVTSLVARQRPAPQVITNGGKWSQQKMARDKTRFLEADFKRMRVYEDVTLMVRDAAVAGTGVIDIYEDEDTNRPEVSRCLIDEFIVDQRECRTTGPRQLHRRKIVDVDRACAMFPDDEDELRKAAERGSFDWTWFRKCPEHHVVLVESWHLPSSPTSGDGLHTIVCNDLVLREEEYDKPCFRQIFFHWSPPVTGFYGRGIADMLRPKQARLNMLRRTMTEAIDLVARPRLFLDHRDAHLKDQINNRRGGSAYVRGPGSKEQYQFQTSTALSGEVYADYERQKAEASLQVGVSPETAAGARLPNLDSAVGYQQVSERELGRHALLSERLEAVIVEIAERVCEIQREIYEAGHDREVTWNDGNLARTIKWSEVDDGDEYVISIKAGSGLNRTLAEKVQQAIQLAQAGALSKEQMFKLIDHPDLKAELDLETAAIRYTDWLMERLEDVKKQFPEPHARMPLDLASLRIHARVLEIETMGEGDDDEVVEVLQRYDDFMVGLEDLKMKQKAKVTQDVAQAAMQQMMAPPGQPGQPQLGPAPPDASPLMPPMSGAA